MMASSSTSFKFSYQKLKQEVQFDEDDDAEQNPPREKVVVGKVRRRRSSSWSGQMLTRKRALKVRIRIPRLLRRKARIVRVAWAKVVRRLKESQSHFGDLFAGNYLFMQVTPTPIKHGDIGSLSWAV